MTILFDKVEDIGGADEYSPIIFWATTLRENAGGDGIVTTKQHFVHQQGGIFTTPDLDPGPAIVQIGIMQYDIVIPDSSTPIRLWPLVDARLPVAPSGPGYIRSDDAGRLVVMKTAEFNDLTALDPMTMYATYDN